MRTLLAKLICCFIPSRPLRHKVREMFRCGVVKYFQTVRSARETGFKPKHYLSICAIAKNEGSYFREWLEFHRLVGVEKFYIYDNESSDDTKEVLKPYIEAGLVEYTYWPGQKQQLPAYENFLKKYKYEASWVAFIDLDEFIVPLDARTVPDLLKSLPPDASQLLIAWFMYGSNGHETRPDGLVIENYKYREADNYLVTDGCTPITSYFKAIINPRMCCRASVHSHIFVGGGVVDENGREIVNFSDPRPIPKNIYLPSNKIRLNHYHCKSWEDYQKRQSRGDAFFGSAVTYTRQHFESVDFNDVYDPVMDTYIEAVKAAVAN